MGKPTEEFQYQTRRLQGQGNSEVYATLLEGRVIIEKKFESPEAARREEKVTRELAVRRDEAGHALSNNDFVFFTTVALQGDKAAIRMDTMAGWTLAEYRDRWLAGGRPWPDDYPAGAMPVRVYLLRVLEAIRETAFALERVHHNRIPYLHCDIKPGNLWIVAGQHPTDRMAGIRIIDFGSAVNLNREDLDALTPDQLLERYRHVCGTPGFWSPRLSRLYRDMNDLSEAVWSESPRAARLAEGCRADLRALTPADDFYSLTATLFWALTGETAADKTADGVGLALEQSLAGVPSDVRQALTAFVTEELERCGGEDEGQETLSPFRHFLQGLEQVEELARSEDIRPETLSRGVESWWEEQDECPFPEDAGLISDKPWTEPENLEDLPQGIPGVEFVLDESVKAFCLEGEAGSGKTSILLCALDQLLKERHQIPLYLPLESFDSQPDWLLRELCRRYLPRAADPTRAVEQLRRMLSGKGEDRFTLLLDGTEQIPPEDQAAFCRMVEQWSDCPRVRLVAAGRRVPELGLPRFYLVPGPDSLEGLEELCSRENWYIRLMDRRLYQVAWLPGIHHGQLGKKRMPYSAAFVQAEELYEKLQGVDETVEGKIGFLTLLGPICCRMILEDRLNFSAAWVNTNGDELQRMENAGLLKRAGTGRYLLARRLRDFLAAIWCAEPGHSGELLKLLRLAKGNLAGMLFDMAELSPYMAAREKARKVDFFLERFLERICPGENPLKRLLDGLFRRFTLPRILPNWKVKGRLVFEAWAYSQWGDLSQENLSLYPAEILDLHHVQLTSECGETVLPRIDMRQIAMLDIPEEILWIDYRDGCLLLTSCKTVMVFDAGGHAYDVTAVLQDAMQGYRAHPVYAVFVSHGPEAGPGDLTIRVKLYSEEIKGIVQSMPVFHPGKGVSTWSWGNVLSEDRNPDDKNHPAPGVWIASDGAHRLSVERRMGRIRLMCRSFHNSEAPAEELWECGVPGRLYEHLGQRQLVRGHLWLTVCRRWPDRGAGGITLFSDDDSVHWRYTSPNYAAIDWMALKGAEDILELRFADLGHIVLMEDSIICEGWACIAMGSEGVELDEYHLLQIGADGRVKASVSLPELDRRDLMVQDPMCESWGESTADLLNWQARDGNVVYFRSFFFPDTVIRYSLLDTNTVCIRHSAPVKALAWVRSPDGTRQLISILENDWMGRRLDGEKPGPEMPLLSLTERYTIYIPQRKGNFCPFVTGALTGAQLDATEYFEQPSVVQTLAASREKRYPTLRQKYRSREVRIAQFPALRCGGGSMEDFARQCAEELDGNDLTKWLPLVAELSPGEVEAFRLGLEQQLDTDANILWLEREDMVRGRYAARLSDWEKEGMPCDLLALDLTKDLMLPEDVADIVCVLKYFDQFSLIGSHAIILTGKEGDCLADLLGEALAGHEEPF